MRNYRGVAVWLSVLVFCVTGCGSSAPLPVVVTTHHLNKGPGLSARFTNETNSEVTVDLLVENQKKNQRRIGTIKIPANGSLDLGMIDGIPFEAGETITMSPHRDYQKKVVQVTEPSKN